MGVNIIECNLKEDELSGKTLLNALSYIKEQDDLIVFYSDFIFNGTNIDRILDKTSQYSKIFVRDAIQVFEKGVRVRKGKVKLRL